MQAKNEKFEWIAFLHWLFMLIVELKKNKDKEKKPNKLLTHHCWKKQYQVARASISFAQNHCRISHLPLINQPINQSINQSDTQTTWAPMIFTWGSASASASASAMTRKKMEKKRKFSSSASAADADANVSFVWKCEGALVVVAFGWRWLTQLCFGLN